MNILIFLLITPTLGFLKNFIKYKSVKPMLYLRTPLLYILLFITLQTNNLWKIAIMERWVMFLFKILRSYVRNDYMIKKEKYRAKYNLTYS